MNGGRSELFMQVRGSKFVRYQECKVQESPDEVRAGGWGAIGLRSRGHDGTWCVWARCALPGVPGAGVAGRGALLAAGGWLVG